MKKTTLLAVLLVLLLVIAGYLIIQNLLKPGKQVEKSIAALPFRNDSTNDSSTYFINGIMEEILSDLSKIEDMKVLSQTSVEPYRNTNKSVAEIAKELGVVYILEGSGQKYGDNLQLRVQLIDAKNDKHLWSNSYEKKILKVDDINALQTQITQSITTEIKALITP